MTKKRLIFDIANFSGQSTITGVLRYVIEVLRRLAQSETLEITTICSLPEEEFALRNFRRFFPIELPFQSKNVERYVLPEGAGVSAESFLKRIEDSLKDRFPESRAIRSLTDAVRTVKWKFFPPPFLSERKTSPYLERLVRESDVYFSPFHPLIPELSENPAIKKFLVVHDLIPVLFADLYRDHRFFRQNPWEEITPDVSILADSESTGRDLLKCYPRIKPEQIATVPLGVDERFVPCDDRERIDRTIGKYGVSPGIPYILSLATLDVRKNFDHVMRCFARLIERNGDRFPELRLVLTGTRGWQDRKFLQAFGGLPAAVKSRIVFTGYVEDEDLPLLYAGAACFCYMSIYEGFGLPPLEAMRCGTPVVTSDNSSLPEVVGQAGILLDAHDEEGLVDAFERLLTEPDLRRDLIEKGFEQANRFSWDRCAQTILEKIME